MDGEGEFSRPELPAALSRWWISESSGHGQAEDPLIACLNDEDTGGRFQAAWLLGLLGDVRAAEPLIAFLKDKDFPPEWRANAAEALASLGDARAVDPLIACLKDKNLDVRKAAAQALQQLGYKPEGAAPGGN
ncbi:MAG: HEAT repeat domain-containing protein [Candidatus Hydrogenedentes bacterium]|nr:HEAT repeat domain-containing protein [Candidatus Hydrogenedentota bacterium]